MQEQLEGVFASHDLDWSSATDFGAKAALAGQLYEAVSFVKSERLALAFDSDLEDERDEPEDDENDLSCLGVIICLLSEKLTGQCVVRRLVNHSSGPSET